MSAAMLLRSGFARRGANYVHAITQIANTVGQLEDPPIICGLARATKLDIDTCADAVRHQWGLSTPC